MAVGADMSVETAVDTLPALLRRNADAAPDSIALRHKDLGRWQEYTWADYADRSAHTGLGLLALGVQPGDRVAIIGENRPEWLWADLGAQGIGAIVVGVYCTSPAEEVEHVLADSGCVAAVVEDEEQLDKLLQVRERLPLLEHIVLIESRGARHRLAAGDAMTFEAL
ncbi:MAG: AMP-binding protein, partial [Gemmatimonadales bacterium]